MHNMIVSASPHHLLELYHGASANIGVEVRSNNKYSFYGEFGKYLPNSLVANNYDQKGFTFSGEIKRYFKSGKFYLSFQYMYGEQSYLRSDPIGQDYYGYDQYVNYNIDKTFRDFSFRYGGLFLYKNWLSFNPYFGLGVRSQFIESDIHEEDADLRDLGPGGYPHDWIHDTGRKTYLKVHAGIRLGIKIF